jgi:predicted TIM-barrel fold metal-dependent hydrolase
VDWSTGYILGMGHPASAALGSIVDCNVHLWDQRENPVFWLSDRTLVRKLIGNYDALPDTYTLADYRRETFGYNVCGIVWSDAGAADPVAAVSWVHRQDPAHHLVTGVVTLGDPTSEQFPDLVDHWRQMPLVRSVRIRLVEDLTPNGSVKGSAVDNPRVMRNLALLARHDLSVTIEAPSHQLELVTMIARDLPDLRILVDHFGWPMNLDEDGFRQHIQRLKKLATAPQVATRIDAIGTVFGNWTIAEVQPWLAAVVDTFGPDRCMLGSDLPIEGLRSGFASLYDAYNEIFAHHSTAEREMLFHTTAQHWYGTGD